METTLLNNFNENQITDLNLISSKINKGDSHESIKKVWTNFIESAGDKFIASGKSEPNVSIDEVVRYVVQKSFSLASDELDYQIEKSKYYEELKQKINAHILEIRNFMQKYISVQEEALNTLAEDSQLANIDLQNMLQKQQQTIQMLSNISKVLHDTALAVIRKIG